MKKRILCLLILSANFAHAQIRNYILGPIFVNANSAPATPVDTVDIVYPSSGRQIYLSNYGSDANTGIGTTGATVTPSIAIATIAKLNTLTLTAGDSVHFKKGHSFFGSLILNNSGSASNPIVVSSYGKSGAKPIITGLKKLTGWTDAGSGIWNITVPEGTSSMNVVTLDGTIQRMGRYPNYNSTDKGWSLFYTGGDVGYLNTTLTGSPNWSGATVVYKQYSYVTNKATITSQSGGMLNKSANSVDFYNQPGDPAIPLSNYGYFIQNDLRTLDQYGEWYFNPSSHLLSMFFGTGNSPTSHVVKVSIIDKVIDLGAGGFGNPAQTPYSYITLNGIDIQGANKMGVSSWDGSNNTVKNCNVSYCYNGVVFWYISNTTIINNSITNITNDAVIQGANPTGTNNINDNTIYNVGQIEGLSASGAGSAEAIIVSGSNTNILRNNIGLIGYTAIYYNGSNILVQKNYVDTYCNIRDDGGAIYTYADLLETNRVVDHNILVNGVGAKEGRIYDSSWAGVHPLYSDGDTKNVTYTYNTISGSQGDGFLGNASVYNVLNYNTFYDVEIGISLSRVHDINPPSYIINNTITNNICWPRINNLSFYDGALLKPNGSLSFAQDVLNIGTVDYNFYRSDVSAGQLNTYYSDSVGGNTKNYLNVINGNGNLSFSQWKSFGGQDIHSTLYTGSAPTLYYNITLANRTVNFSGLSKKDVYGNIYNNSINIAAFESVLLFSNGTAPLP